MSAFCQPSHFQTFIASKFSQRQNTNSKANRPYFDTITNTYVHQLSDKKNLKEQDLDLRQLSVKMFRTSEPKLQYYWNIIFKRYSLQVTRDQIIKTGFPKLNSSDDAHTHAIFNNAEMTYLTTYAYFYEAK